MREEFVDIIGYEGLYQVSNFGNVKSLDRLVPCRIGKRMVVGKSRVLTMSNTGYKMVSLSKGGKIKCYSVHQLVAISFLGHKRCGYDTVVDHINGDKLDNRLSNLQLITPSENTIKGTERGSSKHLGVSWHKRKSKWTATIRIDKKLIHLGDFKCEDEAKNRFVEASKNVMNYNGSPRDFRDLLKNK